MAGLKMLYPSPPNTNFPNPMATTEASTPMYHGAAQGSDRPKMTPVTAAE